MLAIANVLWAQAGPKVEDIAWLLCPLHLVPSRPRQVLKCESRQAHICLVGRSEESWLLRAMYTVAWPRKRSLEAGDVQTRLLSSSAKCISSIYYTINTINTIYVYLHNHPFQTFLADKKLVSNSNRSCIVFLLWGIDLRTVLATHLSSEWRFRGKGGQVAPTCEECWVLTLTCFPFSGSVFWKWRILEAHAGACNSACFKEGWRR